jgi:dienelactone hydrolase
MASHPIASSSSTEEEEQEEKEPKPLADSFVAAHPSFVQVPLDIEKITTPGLFILAEQDQVFTPVMHATSEKLCQDASKDVEFKLYKGTAHGFAVRGQEQDPVVREARDDAMGKMVAFFERTLKESKKVEEAAKL